MTLIEILNKYKNITLSICIDHLYTTLNNLSILNIRENKELLISTNDMFLTLYIKELKFNYDTTRNEFIATHNNAVYFITVDKMNS